MCVFVWHPFTSLPLLSPFSLPSSITFPPPLCTPPLLSSFPSPSHILYLMCTIFTLLYPTLLLYPCTASFLPSSLSPPSLLWGKTGSVSRAALDHWWGLAGPVWRSLRGNKDLTVWQSTSSPSDHQDALCVSFFGKVVGPSHLCLPSFHFTATSSEFLDKLSDHMLLVYTGKTRLARNLLQVSACSFCPLST